jgi:HD-GYP domain-containing protein (c-di-GMP phosphodiesterase class II)
MTHKRPSRHTPLSVDAALKELLQGAGRQFDPPLVNAFVEFIQRESSRQDDFDAFLSEGADEIEYVRVRARMEALIDGTDKLSCN